MQSEMDKTGIASWIKSNERLLPKTSSQNVLRIIRNNTQLEATGSELFFKKAIDNMSEFSKISFGNGDALVDGNLRLY
jgi:hypothetical protein